MKIFMAVATIGAIGLGFYENKGDFNEAVAVMLFYQIGELFPKDSRQQEQKKHSRSYGYKTGLC